MKQHVETYIKKCFNCQKNKHVIHVKYDEIQYQKSSKSSWNEIAMNFIIKLLKSRNSATIIKYDSILMIMNKFIKYSHIISFKKKFTAKQLETIILNRFIKYHEISKNIINDKDKFFTFNYWKTLISLLNTRLQMSIVYHFQTNDQTKRTNQNLEQYLRYYINNVQNNWIFLLSMTQLIINFKQSKITKITFFFANFDKEFNLFELFKKNKSTQSIMKKYIHWRKYIKTSQRCNRFRLDIKTNKIKYFDSSMFVDNRIEWNSWKQNLLTKIWTCEYDFFFERHKINYARDKYKNIIYKIIKHKIVIDSDDSYRILSKFIVDLNNVFEKFDENSKTINEFYNKNFFMKVINKNKNEIFDEFLIRFSATIIDLRFDDEMKISHLRRTMTNKFNYDTKHLIQCKNYRFFCNEVREMSRLNKNMNDKKKMNSTRTTIISIVFKTIKLLQRTKSTSSNRFNELIERFSFHVQTKLQTKNKCFKCFKSSHRKNDVDASCKNDSKSTKKITEIEFVVIDIKWNDNDVADYETNLKKNAVSDYEIETIKHQKN